MAGMLSLDASVVPRIYRVLLTLDGATVGDSTVTLLDADFAGYRERLRDIAESEFGPGVTCEIFPA